MKALRDYTLFEALEFSAKRFGQKQDVLSDGLGGSLNYKKMLLGTKVLARVFRKNGFDQHKFLGVMLPNTVGLAPILLACASVGAPAALLNYTAGEATLISAVKTVDAKVILTSKAFVEKAKLEGVIEAFSAHVRLIYMEDLRAGIGLADKLLGALLPFKNAAKSALDTAYVLFTSGSEGVPKGVALSHANVLANIEQILQRIEFTNTDKMFCALPLFHSFGLLAGLWLPLFAGFRSVLFPSPLLYKTICTEVKRTQSTVFISTDTFLKGYVREAQEGDFDSVRLLVAGAEAVKNTTRELVREKLGLEIFEGYGVTECAPVIAVNTPQENKLGTVGQLFPQMQARLESVEGLSEGGRLCVRGPNVMKGYIFADNPAQIVAPIDGWYDTGDIVSLDEENFIRIQGRAKRFAKVAGEMVSLVAVETLLADFFGEATFAVLSKKDERKGERLVLVCVGDAVDLNLVKKHLKAKGATELMMPADVLCVPEIPLLGSGKVDYVSLQKLGSV